MRNTSNKKCAYCHRTGHTVKTCYAKHDYPPGHPRYPGHPRFNPRDGTVSVNNVAQEVSNHGSNTFAGSSSGFGFHMTQAQYQTLINLLQSQPLDTDGTSSVQPSRANLTQVTQQSPQLFYNPKSGTSFVFCTTSLTQPHNYHFLSNTHTVPVTDSPVTHSPNNISWIIDSRATDHIASSLNLFLHYSKIKPVQIELPNGNVVFSHFSGSVQFSPKFVLHDVLYVSDFTFNLLSISKLISCLNYFLTFSDVNCYIQEMRSLKMIGLGKLKQGLYHLDIIKSQTSPKVSSINNFTIPPITNTNLWHYRLGYLSENRLNILHMNFPFISKHVDDNCDICHLAKQKRLSYSPSFNRSCKSFDLVHMDIWGPFAKLFIHDHKYFLTIFDDFSR